MPVKTWILRFPIPGYFIGTYLISWVGAFLVVFPKLIHGGTIGKTEGLEMFPVMLLGPAIMGVFLTRLLYGSKGLRDLFKNGYRSNFAVRWYLFLLIPPAAIGLVLLVLTVVFGTEYTPGHFFIGFLFGIPAGILEEIGWTGFAFPQLRKKFNFVQSGCVLGLAWGLWHFPVIDFLGSATPQGHFLLPFFLSFTLAMAAIRVFISRIYEETGSILMAQLFHICSTGSLVVLGPQHSSPGQEALWYFAYGVFLWLLVFIFRKGILGKSRALS